ncbi:MAG: hypothetical protein WD448_11480 [Woeseia sp.]
MSRSGNAKCAASTVEELLAGAKADWARPLMMQADADLVLNRLEHVLAASPMRH